MKERPATLRQAPSKLLAGRQGTASDQRRIKGLYAIADSTFNPFTTLPQFVRAFLEGGCRLIQLRMKDNKSRIYETAREIMPLKRRWDFTFIVNDDFETALEVGADGVHVGADDAPVCDIRKIARDRLIIGYSSHSIDEAKKAQEAGADYVAFGAIYPTKTKGPSHPVQGIGNLREVVGALSVPVVAIGGIGRENIEDVAGTGVSSVAMISALIKADDIVSETRWFVERIGVWRKLSL